MISDKFMNTIWVFYEANLTPRTRKEYINVVKNFDKCIGHDPLTLTEAEAMRYYNFLLEKISNRRLSYTTGLMRLSVMRSLCEFIRYHHENHGLYYINHFASISLPDIDKTIKQESLPTEDELNTLLKLSSENNDRKAFLIFSLIIKCGLTSNEISSLNIEHIVIDNNNNMCIQFPLKKRQKRIIKLPTEIALLINQYIDSNQINEGPVFINKRKTRMKIRDAERLFNKYIQLGMDNNMINNAFTMQTLRHAAFVYMLKGGASEDEVAKYGGITTKWMTRYRRVVTNETNSQAIDYSIISIKPSIKRPINPPIN
ncbi:MAG: site-specific integrase [Eubacteriales bacterium]|nr:site-specific integrase [Eubacteriales bacterium]